MNYVGNQPVPAGVVLLGDTNPVGMISFFHNPPSGWVAANGQSLAKVTYPDLWIYAQSFLTADQTVNPGLYRDVDVNNFAVPNLSGLFLRGVGAVDGNHASAGLGVKQVDQNLAHTHTASDGSGFQTTAAGPSYGSSVAGANLAATTNSNGGTEGRPVNVALQPCVKALRPVLVPASSVPVPVAGPGQLVQSRSHVRTDTALTAGLVPFDDTIPQITEGAELFSIAAYAPLAIGNRVRLSMGMQYSLDTAGNVCIGSFFRAGTADALAGGTDTPNGAANVEDQFRLDYEFIAGSLGAFTYSFRAGANAAGGVRLNGRAGTRYLGGVNTSWMRIDEYSV